MGTGTWGVSWEGFDGLGDEVPIQSSLLLSLSPESECTLPGPRFGTARNLACHRVLLGLAVEETGRGGNNRAANMRGQSGLCVITPGGQGTLDFGFLAEDEADENVQAANGKEEECGDKCECADKMGKDGSSNAAKERR